MPGGSVEDVPRPLLLAVDLGDDGVRVGGAVPGAQRGDVDTRVTGRPGGDRLGVRAGGAQFGAESLQHVAGVVAGLRLPVEAGPRPGVAADARRGPQADVVDAGVAVPVPHRRVELVGEAPSVHRLRQLE
jgi:hypothetical protein